jgi:hypothetical protein
LVLKPSSSFKDCPSPGAGNKKNLQNSPKTLKTKPNKALKAMWKYEVSEEHQAHNQTQQPRDQENNGTRET